MKKEVMNSKANKPAVNQLIEKAKDIKVTKRLSAPSWILIGTLYTVAIIKLTLIYFDVDRQQQPQINEAKLVEILDSRLNKYQKSKQPKMENYISKSQFNRMKSELIEEINRVNNKYFELVEQEKDKANELVRNYIAKGPASLTDDTDGKVLPYSIKNENMLWAKYKQKRKRLKQDIEAKKLKFLESLDMKTLEGKAAFNNFQDNSELKLKELEQEHFERLRVFQKQQYLIVDNN